MLRKRFEGDLSRFNRRVINPKRAEISFWASFKSGMKRYAEKTNLHGLVYLADTQRCLLERALWGSILLATVCFGSYMIILAYGQFLDAPTATNKLPNRIIVSEVDFPAVAICSGNRMSRKAVLQYADFVWTNQRKVGKIVGQSVEEIFGILLLMMGMYNFDVDFANWDKLLRLHEFLTAFYGDQYPIEDIMDGFVPKCSDFLVYCTLVDDVNCESIFEFRKTDTGRCCTFNYLRPTEETPSHLWKRRQAFRARTAGNFYGLAIYLKSTLQDDAAFLYSSTAITVKIWDAYSFPDILSGGVKQIMINPGLKYFMGITPLVGKGSPRMRDLDPIKRGCIFDDEKHPQYPDDPPNDCVFLCRHRYLVGRCKCYPFHYVNSQNRTYCTLKDLPCLHNAQNDWLNAEPPVTKQRVEKYLFQCPFCIPKCDMTKYMVQTSFFHFSPELKDEVGSNYLISNESFEQLETSNLLHFFFNEEFVFGNEQTITYSWYDLLSNFGGLVGLTIGGSLIGIAELLYFITAEFGSYLKFLKKCDRKPLCLRRPPIRESHSAWQASEVTHQLYWNELNAIYYHTRKH